MLFGNNRSEGNRGVKCGSDHRLVVAKVYIPYIGVNTERTETAKENIELVKYYLHGFQHENTRTLYTWRLKQKLTVADRSPTDEYEHIKTCITEAAVEALGTYTQNRNIETNNKNNNIKK